MTAFILLYCYLFLVWGVSKSVRNEEHRRRFQAVGAFLGLLFVLGFHSPELGVDVRQSYVPSFIHAGDKFLTSKKDSAYFELGFMNYMVLVKHFTDDAQVYLFVTAVIILLPVVYLLYKYSENLMFSIIIYTSWFAYHFAFSGIRQSIAIGICAVATLFLFKRKLVPFAALVVLASTVHTSAMFFLLAYPLINYRMSNKTLMWGSLCCIVVLVAFQSVMSVVATVLFGADNRYSHQLEEAEFAGVTMMFVYFLFALYQMYMSKKTANAYLSIVFLLAVVQTTGMYSNTIARLAYYFVPLFSMSFPHVLESKPQSVRNLHQAGLLAMFIWFFCQQAGGGYLDVVPFKFFWE